MLLQVVTVISILKQLTETVFVSKCINVFQSCLKLSHSKKQTFE